MNCHVLTMPQGTEEWFEARAGLITASMFSECRKRVGGLNDQQKRYVDFLLSGSSEAEAKEWAGYKSKPKAAVIEKALNGEKVGDFTEAAHDYAFQIAVERLSGELLNEPEFDTWQARRGRELEPEARLKYEIATESLVEQTGIAIDHDYIFGASLDGLVDEDGNLEVKCFLSAKKLKSILISRDISDCMDQLQGGMWITGRAWCDFVLYCPILKSINKDLTIIRVCRDQEYIDALSSDMWEFNSLVESYIDKIKV